MTLRDEILRLCPHARKEYLDGLEAELPYLQKLGLLDNARRWQHFFAQIAHESGGLTIREENLNYSAKRLREVWPKRYPGAVANDYAHKPQAIAEKSYGGRMGNSKAGDGWRYRGRGLMQVTGRNEYRRIGKLIGADLEGNPDLALDGRIAVRAAAAIFADYGCLARADRNDLLGITKAINGGTNGLADRRAWLQKAIKAWPSGVAHAAPAPAPEAPEGAGEPVVPPREPPPAGQVLIQSSRKYQLITNLFRLFGLTGILSVMTAVSDFLGVAHRTLDAVKGFLADHGLIIMVAVCVVGLGTAWAFARFMQQDYEDGRYQPSQIAAGGADDSAA